jgi:2-polyprenyl-6-methoxyphenol hydroxylase-like FAD-dependent oxidoreductase
MQSQVVHRAALQRRLIQGAEKTGVVQLHLGSFVEEYDVDNASFRVSSQNGGAAIQGQAGWITGDILLASDGVKSKARTALLKRREEVDEGETPCRERVCAYADKAGTLTLSCILLQSSTRARPHTGSWCTAT